MSRCIITTGCTVAGSGYTAPARMLKRGDVVELTSAEQTAITGAGGALRVLAGASSASGHDTMGEAVAVANSSP